MDTFVHIQTVQNNEALKIFVLSLKFMWKEKHLNCWLQVRSLFNDNLSMHLALLYMKAYEASPDFRTRRSVSADYRWIGVWCRESNPSESDGVMYCFIRSAVQVFKKGPAMAHNSTSDEIWPLDIILNKRLSEINSVLDVSPQKLELLI